MGRNEGRHDMGKSAGGRTRAEVREFWGAAIRLWEESGLSVRDFCRREGLGEHSFHSWRGRLRPGGLSPRVTAEVSAPGNEAAGADPCQESAPSQGVGSGSQEPPAITFLPVRVVADKVAPSPTTQMALDSEPCIEIVRDSLWRVRVPNGFDRATLDAVLAVLERRPC